MIWSIGRKGGNNNMPTWSDCMSYSIYVSLTIRRLCQKMEYGSIVPDIIGLLRKICLSYICFNPIYVSGSSIKSSLSALKCSSRNIENGEVLKTGGQQIINQC